MAMEIKKLATACGARLFVVEMPDVPSATVGVSVNAGTRDENWPKEAGLAHACEHMVFQGNSLYPENRQLSASIEDLGGDFNAWTSKEFTYFYAHVPANRFSRAAEFLKFLVSDPLFQQEKIGPEMQRIVEEIKMYGDDPSAVATIAADELLYGNHPLALKTLGTENSVASFTQEDFLNWHRRFYGSANLTFFVVGGVSADQALDCFNQLFTDGGGVPNFRAMRGASSSGKKRQVIEKDVAQANVCLGAPLGGMTDRLSRLARFYSAMVSGGMSFPLYQEVADRRGLCYSVSARCSGYLDAGDFSINLGTSPAKLKTALDVVYQVLADNAKNAQLLERTKNFLIGRFDVSLESPMSIMNKLVHDVFYFGRFRDRDEYVNEIHGFNIERISGVVEQCLSRDRFVETMVVPNGFNLS